MNPTAKLQRDVKLLKTYAAATTLLPALGLLFAFGKPDKPQRFAEISVERINVVERDGTVKMVMSNKERFPKGMTIDGKYLENKRDVPGLLFYNDKGEECGGLIFAGNKDEKGNVKAGGHLSFDRFGQDQVIALTYQQNQQHYTAGLTFNDAPAESMPVLEERYKNATPEEKKQAVREGKLGLMPRVYMGTTLSKSSALVMNDQQGQNRLMLVVNKDQSKLDFKDAQGVTRLSIGVDQQGQPLLRFFDAAGKESKAITQ
ncbi:hypothetical protein [Hymenobacter latericus]|uniref:hypothetical protein n=1 Tax=Hymenobacter sp. YIM 151858-1 TaxID=2987688 RepID=UPI0022275DA5|nr:hypothetical protein [Hymenobacter sp. YIM 151858-1]UYZ57386.1 hypothetical protein OIS50_09915 [Hymenobacter sp. YIM 151858-1]